MNNLQELIKNGAFLVDVRTPAEFEEGHVNQSVNIPLDTIESNLSQFVNKTQIVVFCRSGNRSGNAQMILEDNGFTNVTNGGTWQMIKEFID